MKNTENPITVNPKSRGNYSLGIGLTQEQWESIFGKKQDKIDNGDIELGNLPKDRAARGDYELCRKLDPVLKDYMSFKNPKDRNKIKQEYFGRQAEYRKKLLRGG